MRYPPKIYAQALLDFLLAKTTVQENQRITDNFLKFLEKNGDMGKIEKIIDSAKNLFVKKTGKKRIVFETARNIKENSKNLLKSLIKEGDIVEEKINPGIIAGVKITVNDERQLDASILNKIKKLF